MYYLCVLLLFSCSITSNSFATPWTAACQASLSMVFSGKNTEVDCHFSSRGSSRPRDQTCISCIAGGFFTTDTQPTCVCVCVCVCVFYQKMTNGEECDGMRVMFYLLTGLSSKTHFLHKLPYFFFKPSNLFLLRLLSNN